MNTENRKVILFVWIMLFWLNNGYSQLFRLNASASDTNYYQLRNGYLQNYSGTGQDTSEGGEFRQFLRWQEYWGPRLYPSGSFQNAANAIQQYINNYDPSGKISTQASSNWQELGPNQNTIHGGAGRITAISFDPVDPVNIIYAGAWNGGVWKTVDGGQNWFNLNTDQQLPIIGISSIAVDPVLNSNGYYNIYVGTGDINRTYAKTNLGYFSC